MATDPTIDAESLQRDFTFELPLYSAASAWNQSADRIPVDPRSDQRVAAIQNMLIEEGTEAGKCFNKIYVNSHEWSVPIFSARQPVERTTTFVVAIENRVGDRRRR